MKRYDTVHKDQINVGGLDFSWNLENGQFEFEGEDAVLFWITSAMKSFFDTLEEVSGKEAAKVVLETTGYRQGLVVGRYFQSLGIPLKEVAAAIPATYASAGWGSIEISELDEQKKTGIVRLKDSWEYKINVAQGKSHTTTFLAGHFSGIFSGLFGSNVWFTEERDQISDGDYGEFRYGPSDITIEENIHDLARRSESERILKLEAMVKERTQELTDLVKEISSPIIPVLEGIVVVPLLGKYDENRSEDLLTKTLHNLPKYKADYLVIDLTGLHQYISRFTVEFLGNLASAASLIGTETILVGISPDLAQEITGSDLKLSRFSCFSTLKHGIYYAIGQQGRQIY
ncbi:STAS domain-containing protein [Bacillus salacetis]|uniref:STAS domain-containing protein n=1 Tax=Bacillus salacetis TaxID=2315464 RepID=A0A3A1R973_9BACI|nr:STAS domain-containing protein [Bacillus salacetis]RIW38452.1 STAS domain-containing protein [Bacillus salacetis]